MKNLNRLTIFFVGLVFVGCSSSSTTPDSSSPEKNGQGNQYTVVCRNEMQDCFQRCQELCPKGYIVVNRVRGVRVGTQTDYTVIIRCKR